MTFIVVGARRAGSPTAMRLRTLGARCGASAIGRSVRLTEASHVDTLLLAGGILAGPAHRSRRNRGTLRTATCQLGAGRAQERRLSEDQSSWKGAGTGH